MNGAERLPTPDEIGHIIAGINAVIGLGASFPMERAQIRATPEEEAQYLRLKGEVTGRLSRLANAGIYIPDPNRHESLRGLWAWAITSIPGGGNWGEKRDSIRSLYVAALDQLTSLQEILGRGADARGEVLRELRESQQRRDELFIVMAVRAETDALLRHAIDPAADRAGLRAVFVPREDPEEAISEAILSGIRRSVLVLADLTFARPNCYYEAGYARGAFRRVLLSCRRDHDPRAGADPAHRVHFDVDQNRITWWTAEDFDSVKDELVDRLQTAKHELGIA
jgi:hypothetical protein